MLFSLSANGGKADITIAACLLLRSLSGVKRTCRKHVRRSVPGRVHVAWSCRELSGTVGIKGEQVATRATWKRSGKGVKSLILRCRVTDLNRRPTVYKTAALPLS